MKSLFRLVALATAMVGAGAQEASVYKNDFEAAEVGKVPSEMMVLDGGFAVAADGTNKVLELPGAPLETYGLLFGPTEKENCTVSARVFSTSKGRRAPTFSVGLGGVGGYKLQVSPGKKAIELYKGGDVKATAPFDWQSGKWTELVLTVKKAAANEWTVEGGATPAGGAGAKVNFKESEEPTAGRASIGGSPYATTPIRYDDLFTGPAK